MEPEQVRVVMGIRQIRMVTCTDHSTTTAAVRKLLVNVADAVAILRPIIPIADVVVRIVRVAVPLVDLHDGDPTTVPDFVRDLCAVRALIVTHAIALIVILVVMGDSNKPMVPIINGLQLAEDVVGRFLVATDILDMNEDLIKIDGVGVCSICLTIFHSL